MKRDFIFKSKYIMEDEKILSCLGIGEQDTDYILISGEDDPLPTLYKQDTQRYFYNQYLNKWSMVSCTIFAAVGMISDLFNYEFSYDEIKEIDELSYERGRVRGQGWRVQSAVKLVADWWNSNKALTSKYWKVAYYRINKYDDDVIANLLEKNYTLDTSYSWNSAYNKDKSDWVLDWTDFWTMSTYWHSVCIINDNWNRSVKDSGSTNQIYKLAHKLSEIKSYKSFVYVYTKVKEDALDEVKRLNEFKTTLNNMIEMNSKMRHLTNDENYRKKLHEINNINRQKMKDIENELKKY